MTMNGPDEDPFGRIWRTVSLCNSWLRPSGECASAVIQRPAPRTEPAPPPNATSACRRTWNNSCVRRIDATLSAASQSDGNTRRQATIRVPDSTPLSDVRRLRSLFWILRSLTAAAAVTGRWRALTLDVAVDSADLPLNLSYLATLMFNARLLAEQQPRRCHDIARDCSQVARWRSQTRARVRS
jgi:hypothetical protein